MSNYKTLGEVVNGIANGDLTENTVLVNSLGTKAVVSEGSLLWVTTAGYVSTPVSISSDTVTDVWAVDKTTVSKKISFTEGLDLVAQGKTVTFVTVDDKFFEVDRIGILDNIISMESTLEYLYDGIAFYEEPAGISVGNSVINFEDGAVRFTSGTIDVDGVVVKNVGKKLERSDAHRIHHLKHFVGKPVESIAIEYGISTRMVYYILDGTYWNDVYKEFHEDFDVVVEDYIK